MLDLVRSPVAQAIVFVPLLVVASVAAWQWIRSYRNHDDNDITSSDQLSLFREMKQRGELSETEFRSIKASLGAKLRDELKSSDLQD